MLLKMAAHMNLRKTCICLIKNENLQKCAYTTKAQRKVKQKKPKETRVVVTKQLESIEKSLSTKGFLRAYKPYTPPDNVGERMQAICSSLQLPATAEHKLSDLTEKFKLLEACFNDFKHDIPNSQVHELQTIGDVLKYYETTVDTTTPYEALKTMDLPENLHIQYEYLRFNPETDTKFNGQTAFPKSSTLVTGLKYRGKYPGYEAKRSWP